MEEYIKRELNNLFSNIELDKTNSSLIWLSIDLLHTFSALGFRKKIEINCALAKIVELLKNNSFKNKNILISSFTKEFAKTHYFNANLTKPYVGSLSNYLFKKKYGLRTLHPFYSFYIFGKDSKEISINEMYDSVGKKSIFSYLIDRSVELVTVGHHYTKSFSPVHHAEYEIGANYRKLIYFDGVLENNFKRVESKYLYFGRKYDICERSGLTVNGCSQLESEAIVSTKNITVKKNKNLLLYKVNLAACHNFIIENDDKKDPLISSHHRLTNPNCQVITNEMADKMYMKSLNE